MRRKYFLLLVLFICFKNVFLSIDFFHIQQEKGLSSCALSSGAVNNNPANLVFSDFWEINLSSSIIQQAPTSYFINVNIIQPYQDDYAGALDLIYSNNSDNLISFGYSIAGKLEKFNWGTKLMGGYYSNEKSENYFFLTSNFGFNYSLTNNVYITLSSQIPPLLNTNFSVYEKNKIFNFNISNGLMIIKGQSNGFLNNIFYANNDKFKYAFELGGSMDFGLVQFVLSFLIKDINFFFSDSIPIAFLNLGANLKLGQYSTYLGFQIPSNIFSSDIPYGIINFNVKGIW